jgi:hypothetical protein
MQFLYPVFLFALFTLAIPVLVHLFNFRRYKKVYFSNVQFLKEVQERQASRRNIKERLILAARMYLLSRGHLSRVRIAPMPANSNW